MANDLDPPQRQDPTAPAYWRWMNRLWFRVTQPAQIPPASIAFSGTNVVLGHGTSANQAGQEFHVGGTAPISVTFGTSSIGVSHNTSGVVSGTYGSASAVSQIVVNTTGHVTSGTNVTIAIA